MHSIIHSSCPALECLVLVFTVRIGCPQIKSPNLVRIGIYFDRRQLIIQDAPSLQRLILDSSYSLLQITVLSAPKLETLGVIHDLCAHFNMVFGSTVLQVLYIIIYTCNHKLHFKFLRISYISSWSTHFVLILCCSMQSFSMDSLSMVLDSVKILYIQMNSFDLNKIIGLLQCFPCLEKLYIKVIISRSL